MRRVLLLVLVSCGPQQQISFAVQLSALLEPTASLQISVLSDRRTVDCQQVTKGCVKTQFDPARFVELTDASGAAHKAITFALKDGGTQDLEIHMAPGKDFAFVIEALSKSTPPRLAGSSCTYVPEITSGTNNISANTLVGAPDGGAIGCDPRF